MGAAATLGTAMGSVEALTNITAAMFERSHVDEERR